MSVELIRRPQGLGEPLGRCSHVASGTGRLVAVAGQAGTDSNGSLVGSDLARQARQAYRNLGIALGAVGCGYHDILKMNTYLVGHHLIPEFMAVRTEIFADLFLLASTRLTLWRSSTVLWKSHSCSRLRSSPCSSERGDSCLTDGKCSRTATNWPPDFHNSDYGRWLQEKPKGDFTTTWWNGFLKNQLSTHGLRPAEIHTPRAHPTSAINPN